MFHVKHCLTVTQNVTITDQDGPKYLREVVSQTIALRNGYGLMEDL